MSQSEKLLVDVWRGVSRHIAIDESVRNAAAVVGRYAAFGQLMIRLISVSQSSIRTVAAATASGSTADFADRIYHFSEYELQQVVAWGRNGRLLKRGNRNAGTAGLISPSDLKTDLRVIPLVDRERHLIGAALLSARRDQLLDKEHEHLLHLLREPLTAALEHGLQMQQMETLRDQAETDRGVLLRKLGRTQVGDTIVGERTGLRLVMERVDLVSRSDVPVLILGETGTGKEVIARAIHNRSARRDGPFLRVNCGAIPPELIDSQLFGHERGSFTGADESRLGWFERASGGTLFLDEIGELSLDAQVRFLRVLQDGQIDRVGSRVPIQVDVRIVAATHRDLTAMVREQRFREDLWYRLAVFPMQLPPLRERQADIGELASHFAERAAVRFGLSFVAPSDDDVQLLQSYDWPGNIRELGAVIDRAAILGDGHSLEIAKSLGITHGSSMQAAPVVQPAFGATAAHPDAAGFPTLDEAIRRHIEAALQRTAGRIEGRHGAAKLLKINPHTLRARMRKLGIDWTSFRQAGEND